jgi:hypothetical protein
MALGYGPSVTVPSMGTTLAFWLSSPPPNTHPPAFRASWTTSYEALATAGFDTPQEISREFLQALPDKPATANGVWRSKVM